MTSAWPESAAPVVDNVVRRLRAAGCVFAEKEARLLVEACRDTGRLEGLVARRVAGEPLEHLLGWADFAGRRIAVGPGVFVPRRRSELLVRLAVAHLHASRLGVTSWESRPAGAAHDAGPPPAVVVDLCCGSGAIGVAIAAALADGAALELHAADVDPTAVEYARRNLAPWGGTVHRGDLFEALPAPLRGRVQVLTANAPYVPTASIPFMPPEAREHEPLLALDGGSDGLDFHRSIASAAPEWLADGGVLVIEVSRRQAETAAELFASHGLAPRIESDEELDAVAVVGTAGR
ncbi:putative protein N(5)-glutamine methyltransferase [Sinomonas sp. B1-1]|uniref:putative protein N(5)-glutamine methyltransferase n=1 Tax=Sinomonas sp. B1-1 TaxID=3141454 RepID=UPI003D2DF388